MSVREVPECEGWELLVCEEMLEVWDPEEDGENGEEGICFQGRRG
jgi:hypothetical protein